MSGALEQSRPHAPGTGARRAFRHFVSAVQNSLDLSRSYRYHSGRWGRFGRSAEENTPSVSLEIDLRKSTRSWDAETLERRPADDFGE